jgi:2-polyprenyl-3-methyl-5-hydroxy-6-metoxy-1,4-benzoquinol methylase
MVRVAGRLKPLEDSSRQPARHQVQRSKQVFSASPSRVARVTATGVAGFEELVDDASYLDRVASLSFERVVWNRENIAAVRDLLCPWNHNIRLRDGIYTAYCDEYYPAHAEIMRVVHHALAGDFAGKRVLDIGCLEGYFSVECALQGADVVGIDGKLINVKKCEFVKSVLGIETVDFVQDDALAVTKERYGSFDVVLALGLLYHLHDPFSFLDNLSELCDGFVLTDTLIALEDLPESICAGWKPELSPLRDFAYRDRRYAGRLYREFESSASPVQKALSPTASLDNEHSIWLTEGSLIALLRDVGFDEVQKLVYGKQEDLWWADVRKEARVLLLAFRREAFQSKVFRD